MGLAIFYEEFPPFRNRGNNNLRNGSSHIQNKLSLVQSPACIDRKAVLKYARVHCPSTNPFFPFFLLRDTPCKSFREALEGGFEWNLKVGSCLIVRQPSRRIYCADTSAIGSISVTLFITLDRMTPMLRNRNNTLLTLHILSALFFLSWTLT